MRAALCAVFFVSGAAALLFETLWFRQAGLALGNSVWASSLVTASFMAGLAIGSALAARHADRLRRPLEVYALLELLVGISGGLLVVGTDPTGFGGVVAGYSNQRALELLVQAGFSPLEAVKIATLNGAKYLGRDSRIGTIAAGKQADLIVVRGDPSTRIEDVENVEIVFKKGVGFDSPKIFESVKGQVGLH